MAQDYYIRVPVPGGDGNKFEFTKVDIARLTPEVARQLYARDPGNRRNPGRRLLPVSRMQCESSDIPDLSALTGKFDELFETYHATLEGAGDSGALVLKQLFDGLEPGRLFESIARGEIPLAELEWEDVLHRLLSGACTLAEELHNRELQADGVAAGFDQIASTLQANDAARLRIYNKVIDGSLLLAGAVQGLEEIERQLDVLSQRVDESAEDWRNRLSSTIAPFAYAKAFFEGSESDTGFNLHAFNFHRAPGECDAPPDVEMAELHLDECQQVLAKVGEEWQELRSLAEREVVPKRTTIARLCADLATGSRAMRDYRKLFGTSHQPPFAFKVLSDRITPEQFRAAQLIADDHRWGPATTKARIEGLTVRIMVRLEQPKLPGKLRRMLEQAQRFLAQAQSSLGATTSKPLEPTTPSRNEAGTEISADPQRARQLYEMVQCVGLVLTCNYRHLAASTVSAMLDVLRFMGRISTEESATFRSAVYQLSRRTGERIGVTGSNTVSQLRKSSRATWVAYKIKGQTRLKMTERGGARASALLEQYSLSVESIKAGHDGRRAEQTELHKQRKAKA